MMKLLKIPLRLIVKYRLVIIWLGVLGLFGYSLWRFQYLRDPKADPEYLRAKQSNQSTKIEIKDSLKTQLEQLIETEVDTRPGGSGDSDPFNP